MLDGWRNRRGRGGTGGGGGGRRGGGGGDDLKCISFIILMNSSFPLLSFLFLFLSISLTYDFPFPSLPFPSLPFRTFPSLHLSHILIFLPSFKTLPYASLHTHPLYPSPFPSFHTHPLYPSPFHPSPSASCCRRRWSRPRVGYTLSRA